MNQIFINNKQFTVQEDYISGEEIKKIGKIPSSHKIHFQLGKSERTVEISDKDSVDLSKPGAEYFISKPK